MHLTMNRRALILGAGSALAAGSGRADVPSDLVKIRRAGKFGPAARLATDGDIAAYEARYSTALSSGHRAFLKAQNGMVFTGPYNSAFNTGVHQVLQDINTFFGLNNGNLDTDLALLTAKMWFHDPRMVRFAPVLALGGDNCTLIEVNQGKHKGAVFYTDGELFPAVRRNPIEGATVDAIIDRYLIGGWLYKVADSFEQMLGYYAEMV